MLRRFWQLSRQRRMLLIAAFVKLMVAIYLVRAKPFREIAERLGERAYETSEELSAFETALARDVEWAIAAICRRLPKTPTCLMQAIAAKFLLDEHKVPTTLYIGVAPGPTDQRGINAHAWLRCGHRVVTGKAESQRFQPLAWFG